MAKKKITSLDSLMFFTGKNADINAQALEDRKYDIFNDEYIGELNMNKDYDSVFSNTLSEIFVETTPKYNSIKDITKIAHSYILNKSITKPSSEMYVDESGILNVRYDYEKDMNRIIDAAKTVSLEDIKLYLCSLNNAMYNKQKYYSKSKEVYDLSYRGIKYHWMPDGTYLDLYNEDTKLDYKEYVGNDFINYSTSTVKVQATVWDESSNSYIDVFDEIPNWNQDTNSYTYTKVPRMVDKTILNSKDSYFDIIKGKLIESIDEFKKTKSPELLSYYIYDLNTTIPVIADTYSFDQKSIDVNINYDGEFNNWFHNRISFNLSEDGEVNIIPASDYWFNFATNENDLVDKEHQHEKIEANLKVTFGIKKGDNISLLSPYKLRKIDFSAVASKLTGELDLLCDYDKKIDSKNTIKTNWLKEKGSLLEELIIGKEGVNCMLTSINGLENFKNLKVLDLTGCTNLSSNPDLSGLKDIKDYILTGTNVSVFAPAPGSEINSAILGDSIESIVLNDITFKNTNSLEYTVTDKLTSLEINNVKNLDTYKLVKEWLNALDEANKLYGDKAGTVNYINITDVNWGAAHYDTLMKLSKIELDKFTGNIVAIGIGDVLYRTEYRNLIDTFGIENINNPESDLNIQVSIGENAFNIKFEVNEHFTDYRDITNEYGETITEEFENTRPYDAELVIKIEDTVTGNSFIDYIVKEGLNNLTFASFINNNREEVGLMYSLKYALELPENTENPEKLNVGDVLLYGKDKILIVTKESENINQNFTRLGKFTDIEEFNYFLNYDFDISWDASLSSMEDEIKAPDEENIIVVEYGKVELPEENLIGVEYDKISPVEKNFLTVDYTNRK